MMEIFLENAWNFKTKYCNNMLEKCAKKGSKMKSIALKSKQMRKYKTGNEVEEER